MASLESVISEKARSAIRAALHGLEQGGIAAGMSESSAQGYARQAVLGSALLMEDLGDSPARLKDLVTSPGGTTIAGITALEDRGIRGVLMRMVQEERSLAAEGGGR